MRRESNDDQWRVADSDLKLDITREGGSGGGGGGMLHLGDHLWVYLGA